MKQITKGCVWGDHFGEYSVHIDNKCDPGGWGTPIVSIYKGGSELVEEFSICSVTFEQQKNKMQEFYDKWVKPMKGILPLEVWSDVEDAIIKYDLVR